MFLSPKNVVKYFILSFQYLYRMFRIFFLLIAITVFFPACAARDLPLEQPPPAADMERVPMPAPDMGKGPIPAPDMEKAPMPGPDAERGPMSAPGMEKGPMPDQSKSLSMGPIKRMQGEVVSGRIMIGGVEPLTRGRVAFFAAEIGPPSNEGNLRRIPDMMSDVGQDGTFSLRVPAGSYFMGAMSRDLSFGPGPPEAEEKTFVALDDQNNPRIIDIEAKRETKLGTLAVSSGNHAAAVQNAFTVTGTVMDSAGLPVEGAVLLIKINPNSRKPNFIWGKTAKDGRFHFRLPAGRSYYLLARDKLGPGRPRPGQRVGAYTGKSADVLPRPDPVSGRQGETINGLTITLNEVPDPEARKAALQGRQPSQPQTNP